MVEDGHECANDARSTGIGKVEQVLEDGVITVVEGFDNAVVETFFKTLKSELVWRTVFQTRAEARDAIGRYIDGFYNPVRRHSTLDYFSPVQFERLAE
jgi:hypothetical protein